MSEVILKALKKRRKKNFYLYTDMLYFLYHFLLPFNLANLVFTKFAISLIVL